MLVNLTKKGLLPPGIHFASFQEFEEKFATNQHRQNLIKGLKKGLNLLRRYGCKEVYIDGSFVTAKTLPNDIDVCYVNTPMNWERFIKEQPEFNDIKNGSKIQKAKYLSEFYACNAFEDDILRFFQLSRDGEPKGIVKLLLTESLS